MADWQPIATAPKDGRSVLLYGPSGITVGEWEEHADLEPGWWGDRSYAPDWDVPTHWQPLPDPPAVLDHAAPERET